MDRAVIDSLLTGVRDPAVRRAFHAVDRERFVPERWRDEAWADHALPVAADATISQPSLVAKMTEWLRLEPRHAVLEIGTGTGYQTALLAEICERVVTVEFNRQLAETAGARLREMGYTNVECHTGDGSQGWPESAPYDRILVTVAFDEITVELIAQLDPEGLCVIPVGPPGGIQQLIRYRRLPDAGAQLDELCAVRFVSLQH